MFKKVCKYQKRYYLCKRGTNLKINLKIMMYLIIGVYLLGCIIHFRMFLRGEDHLLDGWALVFIAFYFSLLSWIAVLISWCFNTESKPPVWIAGKKKEL